MWKVHPSSTATWIETKERYVVSNLINKNVYLTHAVNHAYNDFLVLVLFPNKSINSY